MTGSGKTYWLKKVVPKLRRIVFYDPKADNNLDEIPCMVTSDLGELQRLVSEPKNTRIRFKAYEITNENFNEFCKICYKAGNLTVIFDEIPLMSNKNLQLYHDMILRMGRSKGVGSWHCIQRPAWINRHILSESEHHIVFKLQMRDDRKKIAGIIGEDAENKINELPPYHYIYKHYRDSWIVCKPI